MEYNPTHFTRKDAESAAREMWSIQQHYWDKLPNEMRLSLMLDAVIVLLSRKIIEGA